MELSLEALRTLVAVVGAGSQREGARLRGLAVPTVSQQLSTLEARLGVPLFEKVGRRAVPTEEARRLVASVAGAFEAIDESIEATLGRHRGVAGAIAIGSPRPFGAHWLTPRLDLLLRAHPALEPTVRYGGPTELEARLLEGTLDFAILVREPAREGLVARRMHEESFVAVSRTPLAPRDLEEALGLPWLTFDEDRPLLERWWRGVFGARARLPTPRAWVADLHALRELALRGHGAVVMPDYFVADDLAAKRLHLVRPPRPRRVRNVLYLVWRKGLASSARRDVVREALLAREV
ncbi:MAG: LysR family transcriptional regulator [Sandaracinus sp.]|nr:LysR family transcriptional regulator [Myxococcales bacterium]MCB9603661.1 LysR family transcriptional regulator [Sandaracinus sp.]MCB9621432.1 LysR family transcriptional regulator [Sandaracinus sp.]